MLCVCSYTVFSSNLAICPSIVDIVHSYFDCHRLKHYIPQQSSEILSSTLGLEYC